MAANRTIKTSSHLIRAVESTRNRRREQFEQIFGAREAAGLLVLRLSAERCIDRRIWTLLSWSHAPLHDAGRPRSGMTWHSVRASQGAHVPAEPPMAHGNSPSKADRFRWMGATSMAAPTEAPPSVLIPLLVSCTRPRLIGGAQRRAATRHAESMCCRLRGLLSPACNTAAAASTAGAVRVSGHCRGSLGSSGRDHVTPPHLKLPWL